MTLDENRRKNKYLTTEKGLELFLHEGVEKVSVREVAEASNLAKRSLFRYFDTKEDLVRDTFALFSDKVRRNIKAVISDDSFLEKTGLDQVKQLIAYYSRLFIESQSDSRYIIGAVLATDVSEFFPLMNSTLTESIEEGNAPLASAIAKGLKDGSISSDCDADQIYFIIYDTILGIMQRTVIAPESASRIDLDKRIELLCSLFLN